MIPAVPRGVFRAAFEALVSHLRGHPLLANKRAVATWIAWDNPKPQALPPTGAMPACQVRTIGGPMRRRASSRTLHGPGSVACEAMVSVHFDLWTAGADQRDLLDLGELIHDALFPQDRAERSALETKFRRAGIHDWQMTRPIFPTSAESFAAECISGSGSLELTIHINS